MEVRNWGREISTVPRVYKEVHRVEEIVDVVKNPETYPSPVRAVGSRHSTTKCIDADGGTLLDMTGLTRIDEPNTGDRDNMTIAVGAGARYYDVSRFLQARGLMHYVNTEIGNMTAGAACVGQTKDSAFPGEHGQVSTYVVGVKFVNAEGKLCEVTEENDPELMTHMRGSFGMLGIVYEVTFKIARLRLMKVYHKVYTLDEFIGQLDDLRSSGCALMYYMMPFINRILVEHRSYIADDILDKANGRAEGDATAKHLLPKGSDWQFRLRNIAWSKVSPLLGSVSQWVPVALKDYWTTTVEYITLAFLATVAGDTVLPAEQTVLYHETPFKSTQCTFSIFAFGMEDFPQVLRDYFAFVREYHRRTGWRISMVDVGYHLYQDKSSYLSYTSEGEVMTLDPVTNADDGWYPFLKEFNEFCIERNGKPLLNQTPLLTREHCKAAFGPQLREFNTRRKTMDPNDRFLSNHFKALFDF